MDYLKIRVLDLEGRYKKAKHTIDQLQQEIAMAFMKTEAELQAEIEEKVAALQKLKVYEQASTKFIQTIQTMSLSSKRLHLVDLISELESDKSPGSHILSTFIL